MSFLLSPTRSQFLAFAALAAAIGVAPAGAGTAPLSTGRIPLFQQVPKGQPSFFVTSRGLSGGNLGGLTGSDLQCATLAKEANLSAGTWRAYLSTQMSAAQPAINVRDRIGKGPWFNIQGIRVATDLAHLHGDTLSQARAGNFISQASALTEHGERIGGKGDPVLRHDMLTGSRTDGRAYDNYYDRTCRNWTYSGGDGSAQIGHSDRDTVGLSISWNSAHQTTG